MIICIHVQTHARTGKLVAREVSVRASRQPACFLRMRTLGVIVLLHHYFFLLVAAAAGGDYYTTDAYVDDMPSSPYQASNAHWNPVISAPARTTMIPAHAEEECSTPPPRPHAASACWDWLLYSPEIYPYFYTPSSSLVCPPRQRDDDLDLLAARLPSWLLALLNPSLKFLHTTNDDNESDQEISSLPNRHDEPLLPNTLDQKFADTVSSDSKSQTQQHRSSTPDTDDGYQSASDASRSDYSQPSSSVPYDHRVRKDETLVNVPKRISYAAAAKPMAPPRSNLLITTIMKAKTISLASTVNDTMMVTNGQKLKFTAPRFERMHHAKQQPPSSSTSTTTKDSSANRTSTRSTTNPAQRHQMSHSTRRR